MSESASPASNAFELTIPVEQADIDQLGHVNNVTYLRWVQDIAVAHWSAIAPEPDRKKVLWLVLRHEIDYKHPAFLRDIVIARTWVGHATRLKFERHTEFHRLTDSVLLAKAVTTWCPIDALTLRPVQVSSELRGLFSVA